MRVALHEAWTVRAVGGDVPDEIAGRTIPATVPGCVHLDLLAAGLIPDPYLDENELAVAWVARADWRYETTFAWTGHDDDHSRPGRVRTGHGGHGRVERLGRRVDREYAPQLPHPGRRFAQARRQ